MNRHFTQINPTAALQYSTILKTSSQWMFSVPSNLVESKRKGTFLILQVQPLLFSFPWALLEAKEHICPGVTPVQ